MSIVKELPEVITSYRGVHTAITTKIVEQENRFTFEDILDYAINLNISIKALENAESRVKYLRSITNNILRHLICNNRVVKTSDNRFVYID